MPVLLFHLLLFLLFLHHLDHGHLRRRLHREKQWWEVPSRLGGKRREKREKRKEEESELFFSKSKNRDE